MSKSRAKITAPSAINLLQFNANKQITSSDQLNKIITAEHIDVAIIQEPYISTACNHGFRPCRRICTAGNRVKATAATVIISPKLNCIMLPESNSWIVGTRISPTACLHNEIIIINVYMSPSTNIAHKLENLSIILHKYNNHPIILAGDFNARSTTFGDVKTNARGRLLEQFVHNHGLSLKNTSSAPTFQKVNRSSLVDMTFTNLKAQKTTAIDKWKVHPNYITSSDHNLIIFSITIPSTDTLPNSYEQQTLTQPLHEVNYSLLTKNDLIEAFSTTTQSIYASTECLCSTIIENMQTAIKGNAKTKKRDYRTSAYVDWWTPELTTLRSLCAKLRKLSQNYKNTDRCQALEEYKSHHRRYRTAIVAAKRKSWLDTCNSAQIWTKPFQFTLGKRKERASVDFFRKDNVIISTSEGILQEIKAKFFPEDSLTQDTVFQNQVRENIRRFFAETTHSEFQQVTDAEVGSALQKLNPRKTPGLDGLNVQCFRAYNKARPGDLPYIVNAMLETGIFPKCLKSSNIIMIKKPNKMDNEVSSYRPISIVPSLSKIFEHIILGRLNDYLAQSDSNSGRQYGFCSGRSTTDLHLDILNEIRSLKNQKKKVAIVGIDISGAFDNCWHSQVINRLIEINCPSYLVQIISSYLLDRVAYVNVHGETQRIDLTRGCPQGSVLGPALWNISVENILEHDFDQASVYAYADDFYLVVSGKDDRTLQNNIAACITKFDELLTQIRLCMSLPKTSFMILDRKRKPVTITVNSQTLQSSTEIKILGIIVDKQLSFRSHLRYLLSSTQKLNQDIRRLKTNLRGTKFLNLQMLYQCCILPRFTYGAAVWYNILDFNSWAERVDSLNRMIAANITRAYKTIYTSEAIALLGKLPIKLAVAEAAARFYSTRPASIPINATIPHLIAKKNFGKRAESTLETFYQHNRELLPQNRKIFIKSVCIYDTTFVGICKFNHKQFIKAELIKFASIYTKDEIDQLSTLYTLEHLLTTTDTGFEIYLENPKLVSLVRLPKPGIAIINNIREQMILKNTRITCTNHQRLQTIFRKMNTSITSNTEEAFFLDDYSTVRLIKHEIRSSILETWNKSYTERARSTMKSFFPTIFDRINSKIDIDFVTTQFISGCGDFNSYLFNIRKRSEWTCSCGAEETSLHLLIDCAHHKTARQTLCSTINLPQVTKEDLCKITQSRIKMQHLHTFMLTIISERKKVWRNPLDMYDDRIHKMVQHLLRMDMDLRRK